MVSPLHFLRKLPRRVTSRPEIEIVDQRSAFSSQTPSIEPSYKTGPKHVKIKISRKVQGFLKKFRVQHVALTVRRPKHPCLVWCTLIILYETFSRLVPRDPNWGDHSLWQLLVPTFRIFEQFDWAPRNQHCKTDMGLQIKIFKLLFQT